LSERKLPDEVMVQLDEQAESISEWGERFNAWVWSGIWRGGLGRICL
jgi:hypothetical protein